MRGSKNFSERKKSREPERLLQASTKVRKRRTLTEFRSVVEGKLPRWKRHLVGGDANNGSKGTSCGMPGKLEK